MQTYLILHMNKPPFNDPRVRRAVFLAIDRQELVKIVRCAEPYGCFGSVGTFLPNKGGQVVESPEDLAQTPGWRQPKDQDIAEAKALMAAAGYANGVKATLNLRSVPVFVRHAGGARGAAPQKPRHRIHHRGGGWSHRRRPHHAWAPHASLDCIRRHPARPC